MAKDNIPCSPVTEALRNATKRLKAMSPAERVRLLVASGAIRPEEEEVMRDRLAAADAAKRKRTTK